MEDGVAKLLDGTGFAGSVCTADRLIKTMITIGDATVEQAVKMASANPARVMGIADRKGTLEVGKDADIVVFEVKDESVNVAATIVGGRMVYKA